MNRFESCQSIYRKNIVGKRREEKEGVVINRGKRIGSCSLRRLLLADVLKMACSVSLIP